MHECVDFICTVCAIFFSTHICLDCSTIYGQATGNREPDAVPLRGHVHNAPLLYRLPSSEEETRQDGRCGPGGVVHVHVLSATLVVVKLVLCARCLRR